MRRVLVGNQRTLMLCDPHIQRCCLDWVELPALQWVLQWGQVQVATVLQRAQVVDVQVATGLEWMVRLD
jgi:hypothetical protein